MRDSASAYHRAKTMKCKEKIENAACYFKVINSLDYSQKYKRISAECSTLNQIKTYKPVECFLNKQVLLDTLSSKSDYVFVQDSAIITSEYCVDYCLSLHSYAYAIFSKNAKECYCIFNLTNNFTNNDLNLTQAESECDYLVYKTGRLSKWNIVI